jgi:hypothetical protein
MQRDGIRCNQVENNAKTMQFFLVEFNPKTGLSLPEYPGH